eukprot:TRINITY_DN9856_c0_g1_i1.p1 TRINITY_DN9856_c0_g1~~TRINITY_DN9856_c0_g1_i1.p1  ORF type:complete len:147 (+),score=32.47 TRINITY_DN9856_c0_g1_i1:197-637(+)
MSIEYPLPNCVLDSKIKRGKTWFKIDWEGYEPTWIDHDRLLSINGGKDALENYNSSVLARSNKMEEMLLDDEGLNVGFENGDKVEEIVGAKYIGDVLHVYILWEGKNICTFVPATIVNEKIPQKVIEFYERRLKFETPIPRAIYPR